MATTIKIPTPTPKLKIPSTTSQLENVRSNKRITLILDSLFMVHSFLFYKGLCFAQKNITRFIFLVI